MWNPVMNVLLSCCFFICVGFASEISVNPPNGNHDNPKTYQIGGVLSNNYSEEHFVTVIKVKIFNSYIVLLILNTYNT